MSVLTHATEYMPPKAPPTVLGTPPVHHKVGIAPLVPILWRELGKKHKQEKTKNDQLFVPLQKLHNSSNSALILNILLV